MMEDVGDRAEVARVVVGQCGDGGEQRARSQRDVTRNSFSHYLSNVALLHNESPLGVEVGPIQRRIALSRYTLRMRVLSLLFRNRLADQGPRTGSRSTRTIVSNSSRPASPIRICYRTFQSSSRRAQSQS